LKAFFTHGALGVLAAIIADYAGLPGLPGLPLGVSVTWFLLGTICAWLYAERAAGDALARDDFAADGRDEWEGY